MGILHTIHTMNILQTEDWQYRWSDYKLKLLLLFLSQFDQLLFAQFLNCSNKITK